MKQLSLTQILSLAALSTLLIAQVGCKPTDAETQALNVVLGNGSSEASDGDDSYLERFPVLLPDQCYIESFQQPAATVDRKIDVLFVTDTSGSLNDKRKTIAEGVDEFVKQLPQDVDYNVAVMLGHGSRGAHSGKLYKFNNDPFVLKSSEMSLGEIRTNLFTKLANVKTDRFSDGGEEGLFSLQKAFDVGMITANKAHGFFRDDAALAVIFIADENDICARYPEGVQRVYDPDKIELEAFARDCRDVTPESVFKTLKAHQGDRPLMVSGILYNENSLIPTGGEEEIGYGYLELIRMTGGLAIDLSSNRLHEGLADIGSLASKKISLLSEFQLLGDILYSPNHILDEESLQVLVDGDEADFVFHRESKTVELLNELGKDESAVQVNYCVKSVENSNPTDEDHANDHADDNGEESDQEPVDSGDSESEKPPVDEPAPPPPPPQQCFVPVGYTDANCDGFDDISGDPIF